MGIIDALTCAVCTQFAFDEKIKNSKLAISSKDIYDFLKEYKMNDKQTYAEYFGISTSNPYPSIDFNQKYSIYTGRFETGVKTTTISLIPWVISGTIKDFY